MRKFFLYLVRLFFLGLIFFEGLNLFKILNFELEYSWFGLMATAATVWFLWELLAWYSKKKYNYIFPIFTFIVPAATTFLDIFGDVTRFYGKFIWYDQMMHFLGAFSLAIVLFFILHGIFLKRKINLSKRFIGFVAAASAIFLGVLYEIEEYSETILLHNNRLGDMFDTPNDLLFNVIGAFCAAGIGILIVRARKKK